MKKIFIMFLLISVQVLAGDSPLSEDLQGDASGPQSVDPREVFQQEFKRFLQGDAKAFGADSNAHASEMKMVHESTAIARALIYADYFSGATDPQMTQMVEQHFKELMEHLELMLSDIPSSHVQLSVDVQKLNRFLAELDRALLIVNPTVFHAQNCAQMLGPIINLLMKSHILLDLPLHQHLAGNRELALLGYTQETVRRLGNILGNAYGKMATAPHVYRLQNLMVLLNEFRLHLAGENDMKIAARALGNTFNETLIMKLYTKLKVREEMLSGRTATELIERDIAHDLHTYVDSWNAEARDHKFYYSTTVAASALIIKIRSRFVQQRR